MNKVIQTGRLTKDPEIRWSTGENPTAVARFTLAVNRKPVNGEQAADFVPCVCFGRTAEFVERYYRKGTKVEVVGRFTSGSYTNRDGIKVYTYEITVEDTEFAESKAASERTASGNGKAQAGRGDGFMNIPDGLDEELPFRG